MTRRSRLAKAMAAWAKNTAMNVRSSRIEASIVPRTASRQSSVSSWVCRFIGWAAWNVGETSGEGVGPKLGPGRDSSPPPVLLGFPLRRRRVRVLGLGHDLRNEALVSEARALTISLQAHATGVGDDGKTNWPIPKPQS
jgi:hypothetical protein